VRRDYTRGMEEGKSDEQQQHSVAVYLIDKLALRVGNEKNTDEEADTVGCCSLRVEHVIDDAGDNMLHLNFLGKDSIEYNNTTPILPRVYQLIKRFCRSKKPEDQVTSPAPLRCDRASARAVCSRRLPTPHLLTPLLAAAPTPSAHGRLARQVFHHVDPSNLNEYFKTVMEGLSAKVFRTYNASVTLDAELRKTDQEVPRAATRTPHARVPSRLRRGSTACGCCRTGAGRPPEHLAPLGR
jgi:DNA topoisomerase-1